MSVNNDYREARKKEIMDILLSNPNQSLLLLKLLPEKYLIDTLRAIFEKHIVPRFGHNASDALVYEMMDRAYEVWKDDCFACIKRNLNESRNKVKENRKVGDE